MESNKMDKIVRDAMQSRTIQPSNSAWERLSDQLDVVKAPKRINWFKYAGYAASVLLLISVAFFMNTTDAIEPIEKNNLVTSPTIDTTEFVKPSFNNSVPQETVIVKAAKPIVEENNGITNKGETEKPYSKKVRTVKMSKSTAVKVPNVLKGNPRIVMAKNTPVKSKGTNQTTRSSIKIDSDALLLAVTKSDKRVTETTAVIIPNSSKKLLNQGNIKINSEALLYAVTNPNKDISEYYKKYHIDRNEVLKNIQKELNKVNLSIDAATLLTSVEKNIDEETFKKSFMQVVKGKITGFASAFANRNN